MLVIKAAAAEVVLGRVMALITEMQVAVEVRLTPESHGDTKCRVREALEEGRWWGGGVHSCW